MQAMTMPPSVPVGEIKSFGPFGPKYEVGRALQRGKIPPPLDWLPPLSGYLSPLLVSSPQVVYLS